MKYSSVDIYRTISQIFLMHVSHYRDRYFKSKSQRKITFVWTINNNKMCMEYKHKFNSVWANLQYFMSMIIISMYILYTTNTQYSALKYYLCSPRFYKVRCYGSIKTFHQKIYNHFECVRLKLNLNFDSCKMWTNLLAGGIYELQKFLIITSNNLVVLCITE